MDTWLADRTAAALNRQEVAGSQNRAVEDSSVVDNIRVAVQERAAAIHTAVAWDKPVRSVEGRPNGSCARHGDNKIKI